MFILTTMRKLRLYVVTILALMAGANTIMAQELKYGVDFVTLFDNTEYAGMQQQWSETLFSARLTPKVSLNWDGGNELVLASDFTRDFGHKTDFVSDTNLHFYYGYRAPQVRLMAGIFPRSEMRGLRSELFFDRHYRYYHNTLSGVLARKESASGASFIEFAMDYNGKRTETTREAFAIMTSARYAEKALYVGYDIMIGHYAKDYNEATRDDVVDNFLLTPFVGYQCADFDIGVKYVQSVQRDRVNENVFEYPKGIELYATYRYNKLTVHNVTYWGESPFVYYGRYGKDLYHGLQHYAPPHTNYYDAVTLCYTERFAKGSVLLDVGFTIEDDGTGLGTRQWLSVSVMLDNLRK